MHDNSDVRPGTWPPPPNVNLGPPHISESTARKLNLKMPLDVLKYPFWVQKLLHYI